jgi:hypothetical protein
MFRSERRQLDVDTEVVDGAGVAGILRRTIVSGGSFSANFA